MQSKRPPKVPSVVHGETLGQRIHGSRREIRVIVIPEGLGIMAVPWKTGCRTRTQRRIQDRREFRLRYEMRRVRRGEARWSCSLLLGCACTRGRRQQTQNIGLHWVRNEMG